MVVTLSTTPSSSTTSATVPEIPTSRQHFYQQHSNLFFNVSPKPKLCIFVSNKPRPSRMVVVKTQLNKVATEGSNNAPAISEAKSGLPLQETAVNGPSKGSAAGVVSEESMSEFMSQVSDLVKLVDSRDITELKLKQFDCEILIRKNLVVPPTQSHAPVVTMQSPPPMASPPSAPPPRTPSLALPAPAAKSAKSSIPPVLSPMAGTFYRCPGPGEPPFLKVGDKVQKGQVLCIIEAMKLMNEIQAEQAGTVIEVHADDAKPISKDSPLFTIQP